ncbi:MAG: nicotinamide riboside transporter PnuC [Rickettsiales bacterium]|jgi:nicotinamide mononucleotide transporter PnuC|nr:nicotinamide riboside transporter PnuC [Rickettsiales bacterium]
MNIRENLDAIAMPCAMAAYFAAAKYALGLRVAPLDAIASLFMLASLLLIAREKVYGFFFGIAACATYLAYFLSIELFGQAILQLFAMAVNCAAIYSWTRPDKKKKKLEPSYMEWKWRTAWLAGLAMTSAIATRAGAIGTLDFTSIYLVITGQAMIARKKTEGWAVWAAADAAFIILFLITGAYMTAFRALLTMVIEIRSFIAWRRKAGRGRMDS